MRTDGFMNVIDFGTRKITYNLFRILCRGVRNWRLMAYVILLICIYFLF